MDIITSSPSTFRPVSANGAAVEPPGRCGKLPSPVSHSQDAWSSRKAPRL